MNVLAIESSGLTAGAAVVCEEKTIAEFNTNYIKNHSQTLMPMVDRLLAISAFSLDDIDYIACSSGPGSFTGLRIGAATAKGLAAGINKPIIPVPTLDALAYTVFKTEGIIAPVMDARRDQVYTAFYVCDDSGLKRLTDYDALDIDKVLDMAAVYGRPVTFLGDGMLVYKEKILQKGFFTAAPNNNMQRAASVGSLALTMTDKAVPAGEFAPFYIRKPQAEREFESRQ